MWEENEDSYDLFVRNQGQWRVGMNGPYALDYNVLYSDMAMRGYDNEKCESLMFDIRIMEAQALKEILSPA